MIRILLGPLLILLLWPSVAAAHPLAPVGLSVRETGDGVEMELKYSRVQPRGRAVFAPRFPSFCTLVEPPSRDEDRAVIRERFRLRCSAPLAGPGVSFGVDGLSRAAVDGVVRIQLADGQVHHGLIDPTHDMFDVPAAQSSLAVAKAYIGLGFEHLALGFDHVLLVLGLALLLRRPKRVLLALTAFTLGHATSLCAATFSAIALPRAPVEIGIAATLMWLAWEVMGHRSGELRRPYAAAIGVGLVHGLGFATALAEAGLSRQELPLALAGFHVGIELGQLLFVALALGFSHWADAAKPVPEKWRAAPALAIGSVAAMWCIERAIAAVV
jgi:hypothetical protein